MPTLYANRAVLNAPELIAWAKAQGFTTCLLPEDMHVTQAYSKAPLEWPAPDLQSVRAVGGPRTVEQFGDGAVVLTFASGDLSARWSELEGLGARSKHPEFRPHVTLTYSGAPADLSRVQPYAGPLVLGPERFAEIQPGSFDPTALVEKNAPMVDFTKTTPTAGDVHTPVPMGGKNPPALNLPSADDDREERITIDVDKGFDEEKHPRAADGKWTETHDAGYSAKIKDFASRGFPGAGKGSKNSFSDSVAVAARAAKRTGKDHLVMPTGLGYKIGAHDHPEFVNASKLPGQKTLRVTPEGDAYHRVGNTGRGVKKQLEIIKADAGQRIVYGWASVISEHGVPHVDTQGDVIEPDELRKATTEFMLNQRYVAEMHKRRMVNGRPVFDPSDAVGAVVHSFPMTADLMKALGLASDREGWIVGVHVSDDVMKRVESGELAAFSIGGAGERVPIEA